MEHEDDPSRVEAVEVDGVTLYVLSVPLEPTLPDALTRSEREVVLAALRGEGNAAIADARGCATQTVANQLRSAFKKMGVNSRAELAAKVYGDGPAQETTST